MLIGLLTCGKVLLINNGSRGVKRGKGACKWVTNGANGWGPTDSKRSEQGSAAMRDIARRTSGWASGSGVPGKAKEFRVWSTG